MTHPSSSADGPRSGAIGATPQARPTDQEVLKILFDLGREVASVLDLDELLRKVPRLIERLVDFQAFAVYLLDERRGELTIAYSVGYPEETARSLRLRIGEALDGTAVAEVTEK